MRKKKKSHATKRINIPPQFTLLVSDASDYARLLASWGPLRPGIYLAERHGWASIMWTTAINVMYPTNTAGDDKPFYIALAGLFARYDVRALGRLVYVGRCGGNGRRVSLGDTFHVTRAIKPRKTPTFEPGGRPRIPWDKGTSHMDANAGRGGQLGEHPVHTINGTSEIFLHTDEALPADWVLTAYEVYPFFSTVQAHPDAMCIGAILVVSNIVGTDTQIHDHSRVSYDGVFDKLYRMGYEIPGNRIGYAPGLCAVGMVQHDWKPLNAARKVHTHVHTWAPINSDRVAASPTTAKPIDLTVAIPSPSPAPALTTMTIVDQGDDDDATTVLCYVCMDRVANIQSKPCGCITLCDVCVHGLVDTADAYRCGTCLRTCTGRGAPDTPPSASPPPPYASSVEMRDMVDVDDEDSVVLSSSSFSPPPPRPSAPPLACMLCAVRPPTTMVLPCRHQVLCHPCSALLRGTNMAYMCAACNQPVERIVE